MKREPNITEQQAREIVEKMGRRESYTPKSMDDLSGVSVLNRMSRNNPAKPSLRKQRRL